MRTEERTASTNSLSMGTAEVLGWTSRRRPKRRGTDGMMRGGRTRGFGGFDGGEEVIAHGAGDLIARVVVWGDQSRQGAGGSPVAS